MVLPRQGSATSRPAQRRHASPTEPSRPVQPSRRAATGPGTSSRAGSVRRARRGVHLRFSMFAGIVLAVLAVGVVTLNVFLAQSAFHVTSLREEVGGLSIDYDTLTDQAAGLSSPSRVAAWAHSRGMTTASHQVILHTKPRGSDPSTQATASNDPGGQALALEPVATGGR